jgi:hypothetical protein
VREKIKEANEGSCCPLGGGRQPIFLTDFLILALAQGTFTSGLALKPDEHCGLECDWVRTGFTLI